MATVGEPYSVMFVRVTHLQFSAALTAKERVDAFPSEDNMLALETLLLHCALANGGDYDPVRHRAGGTAELRIVV